jgi:hypothetical protein
MAYFLVGYFVNVHYQTGDSTVWWHRLTANRETHALEMIGSIPSATLRNSSINILIGLTNKKCKLDLNISTDVLFFYAVIVLWSCLFCCACIFILIAHFGFSYPVCLFFVLM